MLKIGCHLSSSKGYLAMGKEAVKIGANTFQFFTRNPRGGKAKPLDLEDVAAYRAFSKEHGLFPILAHAPYTLNACAARRGPADLRPGDHGRRPGPAGEYPREPVQLPPRQPCEAGGRNGHRADRGAPQRHV